MRLFAEKWEEVGAFKRKYDFARDSRFYIQEAYKVGFFKL